MYSQEAIDVLVNRIGWSDLSSDLSIDLSVENKTAESGKTFDWYHSLAQIGNIYSAVPKVNMDSEDFNELLLDLKKKAVSSTLTSILDKHYRYDFNKDYSNEIIDKASLFDDVIGYTVAIKVIELLISTNRKNAEERNASMSYQTLKVELNGAKNEGGHYIAKGIYFELSQSIKKAQRSLFPFEVIVRNGNCQ
ncbi:MAG: hypothetical protein BM557_02145 [Flavobacterium sp. MedPE-SWcel]|uniref:hypothetical protein n=1 Tax=uncultured Flavobacterium sp. TaxID=165435 RepID=UPI00091BB5AC|nr:hypothetical protein [uncultured Flavobacterium sp.]OIQ22199.1 MAG: hypothetical protein BM557_02145 [Flavobacterium sp. MedPE-SWcel]